MKRILVGTDGSPGAARAVGFAAALAQQFDAELIVAHAMDGVPDGRVQAFIAAEHISIGDFLTSRATQLLGEARTMAEAAGAPRVRVAPLSGDAAQAILEAVAAERIDAVIVGKRGQSRLSGLLLGSTSQKLVSLAPCIVAVVP